MENASERPTLFLLIMLAALTAFAPFVTDMYLPALPSMTESFSASTSQVQLGLTTSMLGLAIGQLIIGPLSDKYGRKFPLIATLVLFAISSALCIFSSSITMFVALRLIQGLGASGGVVLARSIATDLCSGKALAAVMAIIGAISGIAPVISPLLGGWVLTFSTWHMVFAILLGIGIILLAASFRLPESYPAEKRQPLSILQSFGQIRELIKNRIFMTITIMQAAAMFAFFGQISASPFIFQTHYGFTELQYSAFFGTNALAIGIFAFLSTKFKAPQNSLFTGTIMLLISAICVSTALYLNASPWLFECCLFAMMGSFGLILAPSTAIAMNAARKQAGLASAVLGAAGFLSGGIASPIVGLGNIQITTGIVFIASALLTFLITCTYKKIDCDFAQSSLQQTAL
ncbi:MAG: multidrug effflux MFS transporter [Proteobacteria bacterium]|nr:multidrug effflux MFS transporter [Pseudomonadota bacterium]